MPVHHLKQADEVRFVLGDFVARWSGVYKDFLAHVHLIDEESLDPAGALLAHGSHTDCHTRRFEVRAP